MLNVIQKAKVLSFSELIATCSLIGLLELFGTFIFFAFVLLFAPRKRVFEVESDT